jgi:hypothetical protein
MKSLIIAFTLFTLLASPAIAGESTHEKSPGTTSEEPRNGGESTHPRTPPEPSEAPARTGGESTHTRSVYYSPAMMPQPTNVPAEKFARLKSQIRARFGAQADQVLNLVNGIFGRVGYPDAIISGTDMIGAVAFGYRIGKGEIEWADSTVTPIYWQGITSGFEAGAAAFKIMFFLYDVKGPEQVMGRRFFVTDLQWYYGVGVGSGAAISAGNVFGEKGNNIKVFHVETGVGLLAGIGFDVISFWPERRYLP